jgi:hypothetical protein
MALRPCLYYAPFISDCHPDKAGKQEYMDIRGFNRVFSGQDGKNREPIIVEGQPAIK